jgi:hypothetical protein
MSRRRVLGDSYGSSCFLLNGSEVNPKLARSNGIKVNDSPGV